MKKKSTKNISKKVGRTPASKMQKNAVASGAYSKGKSTQSRGSRRGR